MPQTTVNEKDIKEKKNEVLSSEATEKTKVDTKLN